MTHIMLPEAEWPVVRIQGNLAYVSGFFSVKYNGGCHSMRWTPEEPTFYDCGCITNTHTKVFDCRPKNEEDCDFRMAFL